MALIRCPECGEEVSDKAKACIHCGAPLEEVESKVLLYGLKQMVIGGTLKVYLDDEFIGKVSKGDFLEIPLVKDGVIKIKCGINPVSGHVAVKAGKLTKIQVVYNRLTGGFIPQIVDTITG